VTTPEELNGELDELIRYIRATRGFDFAAYKRTTLTRRVHKRMEDVKVSSFSDYRDVLEADAAEFNALFNTILINVTGFFRDKPAWDYLSDHVLPDLLARQESGKPLRCWSAGCASGQEPYSLAMALAEKIGTDDLRDSVKVYATDIDQNALEQARQGRLFRQGGGRRPAPAAGALLRQRRRPVRDQERDSPSRDLRTP
jgi:two-component system, chemotaxis family, CheB/CheR fusion protein